MNELINFPAIKALWKYNTKPFLLKPDLVYKSFIDIDIKELKRRRVSYVVIDKDNTLTIPYELKYANESINFKMKDFREEFGYYNIAVLSNSIKNKHSKEYNVLQKEMNVSIIEHKYSKPHVHEDIMKHFGLNKKKKDNRKVCIIGDRLFVDVLTGKENNYITVLVSTPITLNKENIFVRTVRLFETHLVAQLKI